MIRYLFNTIKIVFLIFILLFLAFVINNLGDEELNPEVVKALDWKAPEHTFEDNGYLILLGIEAPIEMDAALVGKKLQKAEIARFAETQKTHKDLTIATQAAITPYIDWKDNRCEYSEQKNCVEYYLKMDAAKLTFVISSQERLIKRFQAIKQSKYYVEAFTPLYSSSFPSYKNLVLASELERIQAILDFSEGKTAQGIVRFTENAAFSRRMLRESTTLVSHMIAVSMMQRDTRILSELLMKYPALAKQYKNQLYQILAPISTSEFNLVKSFTYERDMALQTMHHLKHASANELIGDNTNKFSQILMWLGFQSNTTVNDAYMLSNSLQKMGSADAFDLDNIKEARKKQYIDYFEIDHTVFVKKNPVGRILNSIASPDYYKYIERQHDLDGYLTIVGVQLTVLADETPVNKTVITFHNPYTREVMPYDKDTGTLTFEGRQPSNTNFNKSKQYQVKLQ
jgi:hypothetical protein